MAPPIRVILCCMLLPLSGCHTAWNASEFDFERGEAASRKEYEKQFGRYTIPQRKLPSFEWKAFDRLQNGMLLAENEGARLVLHLGNRRTVEGSSRFRTSSHYLLLDASDRTLATAESTIALEDVASDSGCNTTVFVDRTGQELIIAEELSWSTHRTILMRGMGSNALPSTWETSYLRLPVRQTINPVGSGARILGLGGEYLYFGQEGRIYRFPLKMIQRDSDLNYTRG